MRQTRDVRPLRNIERTRAYREERTRRLKDGGYAYAVDSQVLWDPLWSEEQEAAITPMLKQKFPEGIRGHRVTTPEGLHLVLVKERGEFRMLFIWLCPYY